MRTSGQRIVASLRQKTYQSALRQEVECIEKGEGDILSRLSVDSSLVGESYVCLGYLLLILLFLLFDQWIYLALGSHRT